MAGLLSLKLVDVELAVSSLLELLQASPHLEILTLEDVENENPGQITTIDPYDIHLPQLEYICIDSTLR